MVGCPVVDRRSRGALSTLVLAPLVCALVLATARRSASFVAGFSVQNGRGSPLARNALASYDEPIRRRDGFVQENMQRWISQQVVLVKREAGVKADSNSEKAQARKAAYLAKLGLGDKIKSIGAKPPWHVEHIKGGDVLEGFFSHPDIQGGDRLDFRITAESDTAGSISSDKGGFENDVEIRQDFPIAFEAGEQQDMDMTTYIFNKFNMKWRDFEGPYPTSDELEHLSLKGMQMWFKQVAEVDGFPDEETFRSSCADPAKGMAKEEFLDFIRSDDPAYIATTFQNVFTGRRVNIVDSELTFDGDFQKEAVNHVFGYVTYMGRPGGTFELVYKP